MIPKEVLAAAETVASYLGRGGWYAIDREADLCARHIIATVRADDDEPMGEFWFSCLPNAQLIEDDRRHWRLSTPCGRLLYWPISERVYYSHFSDGHSSLLMESPTRGQFRSLCRALGLTLPEVPA